MLIKSTQWNNLRYFPKACTRIFNNVNFRLQGHQIGAFQQRYLKYKCETPYFESELVPKTCKSWKISSNIIFLSGLVTKLENLFVFGKNLWKISSNRWFQKNLLTDLTSAQTLKVCFRSGGPLGALFSLEVAAGLKKDRQRWGLCHEVPWESCSHWRSQLDWRKTGKREA